MAQTRYQWSQRREFKNELTELIQNTPNFSVLDLLCHRELAPTVRNEPSVLLEWLKGTSTDGTKRVHTLVDWALTDKYNTEDIRRKYKIYQINRNAATFLSSPSRKLYDILIQEEVDEELPYLFKALKKFTESDLADDPHFSGHFCRIMEMLLMKDSNVTEHMGWDFRGFLDFCLERADTNAYIDLVSRIPVDCQESITEESFPKVRARKSGKGGADKEKEPVEPITRYFMHVLQFAVKDVFTIESKLRRMEKEPAPSLEQDMGRSLNFSRSMALRNRPKKSSNPVDRDMKPLPDPEYLKMSYGEIVEKKDVIPGYEARVKKRRARRGYSNSEGKDMELAKTRAYMAINSIAIALENDPSVAKWLQHKKVIALLLECAIYADDWSMVSIRAFKILRKLIYGSEELDIKDTFDEFKHVIEKYSKDFLFREELTPKMLAAFPIFWFCRYKSLSDPNEEYPDLEYHYIDVDETIYKPKIYKRPEGKSPLEFYVPLLLDEPAISDQLLLEIYDILRRAEAKCIEIRAQFEEEWKDVKNRTQKRKVEFQDRLFEQDVVRFEFMRSQFLYKGKITDIMSSLIGTIPIGSWEDFYQKHANEKYHTTLNGNKWNMAMLLVRGEWCEWKGEFTDLAWAAQFDDGLLEKYLLPYEEFMKKIMAGKVEDKRKSPSGELKVDDGPVPEPVCYKQSDRIKEMEQDEKQRKEQKE